MHIMSKKPGVIRCKDSKGFVQKKCLKYPGVFQAKKTIGWIQLFDKPDRDRILIFFPSAHTDCCHDDCDKLEDRQSYE